MDCYIAFLDLLGFKNLVFNNSCEDILLLFENIQEEYQISILPNDAPLFDHSALKTKIMSDTICFYVDAAYRNALAGLLAICNYFQVRLFRLANPILTRGAIVRDKIYAEGDITFGPGVINAYQLEEKVAKQPRIILTKSVIDSCENVDDSGKNYINMFTYIDYDFYYAVDSLFLFYGLNHSNESWKSFARHVQKKLDTEMDMSIREKYIYIENNISRIQQKYLEYIKENPHA